MLWSKPDFVEITLCMEVTAYVNTDDKAGMRSQDSGVRNQESEIREKVTSTPTTDS
jgi:coenzyme PQQ precursor peptide PqqA